MTTEAHPEDYDLYPEDIYISDRPEVDTAWPPEPNPYDGTYSDPYGDEVLAYEDEDA